MGTVVRRTISLSRELDEAVQAMAEEEGKSFSAVIQDALRTARERRLKGELSALQSYWSAKAREKGVLSPRDLERLRT